MKKTVLLLALACSAAFFTPSPEYPQSDPKDWDYRVVTARPAPDQSLIAQGWYCIYVPANNSPVSDWQTYNEVNWWVELCYGGVYTIWRAGDADGWYWYLRLGTTTAR